MIRTVTGTVGGCRILVRTGTGAVADGDVIRLVLRQKVYFSVSVGLVLGQK